MPRLFVPLDLHAHSAEAPLCLPAGPARHVQVLRLQPGAPLVLFDGLGGEWGASVLRIGRSDVEVRLQGHAAVEREIATDVTLAFGMPANERMDALIEKATELGVATVQPLVTERSVLRLAGERAERKRAHWQAIAVAACEQCGRNRVPRVEPVRTLVAWLAMCPPAAGQVRWLLALRDGEPLTSRASRASRALGAGEAVTILSGPEGGLAPAEEAAARDQQFLPASLGPRVLRADTAPLAALAALSLVPASAR